MYNENKIDLVSGPETQEIKEKRMVGLSKVDAFVREVLSEIYKGKNMNITKDELQLIVDKTMDKLISIYNVATEEIDMNSLTMIEDKQEKSMPRIYSVIKKLDNKEIEETEASKQLGLTTEQLKTVRSKEGTIELDKFDAYVKSLMGGLYKGKKFGITKDELQLVVDKTIDKLISIYDMRTEEIKIN